MTDSRVNCWNAALRISRISKNDTSKPVPHLVESELGFVNLQENDSCPNAKSKYTNQYIRKWKCEQKHAANEVYSSQVKAWCGWLQKRNHLLGWQPRWFQVRWPHPALDGKWVDSCRCAVLVYQSDEKGEVLFYVKNVRRERWLDSGGGVALSVGLLEPPTETSDCENAPTICDDKLPSHAPCALRWARSGERRVRLMATSDLEAVAILITLRRMLQPGCVLPTPHEAVRFPARTLRTLC